MTSVKIFKKRNFFPVNMFFFLNWNLHFFGMQIRLFLLVGNFLVAKIGTFSGKKNKLVAKIDTGTWINSRRNGDDSCPAISSFFPLPHSMKHANLHFPSVWHLIQFPSPPGVLSFPPPSPGFCFEWIFFFYWQNFKFFSRPATPPTPTPGHLNIIFLYKTD